MSNQYSKEEVITRRSKVAALRLAGEHRKLRIADELHVSRATIARDFAAIDADWRKEWAESANTWKEQDAERIEALIRSIWVAATTTGGKGQTFAIDRVLALVERRARMFGYDAPTRINLVDTLRQRAAADGLDPDAIVKAAEELLKEAAV